MSNLLQRRTAVLTALVSLGLATAALAQMPPTSPWKKAAPFPKPDEELYGAAANGKMYVMGGWADGKAGGFNYVVRPRHRQMDREKVHAAAGPPRGHGHSEREDLRLRWFHPPRQHDRAAGRRVATH